MQKQSPIDAGSEGGRGEGEKWGSIWGRMWGLTSPKQTRWGGSHSMCPPPLLKDETTHLFPLLKCQKFSVIHKICTIWPIKLYLWVIKYSKTSQKYPPLGLLPQDGGLKQCTPPPLPRSAASYAYAVTHIWVCIPLVCWIMNDSFNHETIFFLPQF